MTYIRSGEFRWESDGDWNGKYMADDGTLHNSANAALKHNKERADPLTSPVAPPPPLTFERWFSLWDTTHDPEVKRLCGIAWSAGFTSRDWHIPDDAARPSQPETEGEIGRQPELVDSPSEQPPVAPGEQPPQPICRHGVAGCPECKTGIFAAPPAQERASDEHKNTLVDIIAGNTWEQSVAAFERALATAAKQAREEALEKAAQLCDAESVEYRESSQACRNAGNEHGESADFGAAVTADAIAKKLRTLAVQPSTQTKEDVK